MAEQATDLLQQAFKLADQGHLAARSVSTNGLHVHSAAAREPVDDRPDPEWCCSAGRLLEPHWGMESGASQLPATGTRCSLPYKRLPSKPRLFCRTW